MSSVVFCLLLMVPSASIAETRSATLFGHVTDESGGVLREVVIAVTREGAAEVRTITADDEGAYRVEGLSPGRYRVEFRYPNFATLRRDVSLEAGEQRELRVALPLRLSADVTVTGKRTFRNLADLEGNEGSLVGVADSASEGLVTGRQIDARPIMRAGEVLESVPGVIISQHSGEGKANQYYLRGFNLDHGTDFATTVAGVPVNMPTHAHGHGYSDLNFLIPELVSAVQFRKGPYFADEGDFSAAGASHIRYVNALDAPLVRVSGGEDGWGRGLVAASPKVGPGRLLVAAEVNHNDGPWERGDDYRRLNGVMRYSQGTAVNGWSVSAMGYDGSWRATDQAPRRAIEAGTISRFAGIDDSTGGDTHRLSLSGDWQRTSGASVARASAYVMKYALDLFSNFTYFLDDPVRGDQFQQTDRRVVGGGRVSYRRAGRLGGRPFELSMGADLRHDAIGRVALLRTERRQLLAATRDDAVRQTSVAGYVQHEMQWTRWIRSSAGLRLDRFAFDVDALTRENSGTAGAGRASPKASLIIGPWRFAELYVNGGYGYHSNDARGTTIAVDPASGEPADRVTPLVRARGTEVGARLTGIPGFETDLTLWRLDIDSELLFVGDAGTTEASRPSRRWGVEWNTYYAPAPWLTVDADLAWSRARFADESEAGNRIPGAVERVASAGLTLDPGGRAFGSLRLRYFGGRNLLEDGSIRSAPTRLVNGQAGVRVSARSEVVLDGFNLLDAAASDIDYFYASRLPGEAEGGVDDLHTHPTLPRTMRLSLRFRF